MRAQLTFKDFPLLNEVMFMVIVDEYSIYMDTVLWHTILLDVRCSESQLSFTSNIVHFVLSSGALFFMVTEASKYPADEDGGCSRLSKLNSNDWDVTQASSKSPN